MDAARTLQPDKEPLFLNRRNIPNLHAAFMCHFYINFRSMQWCSGAMHKGKFDTVCQYL
jgi:hypothetical protein